MAFQSQFIVVAAKDYTAAVAGISALREREDVQLFPPGPARDSPLLQRWDRLAHGESSQICNVPAPDLP